MRLAVSCQKYGIINWPMNQSVDMIERRLFLSLHTIDIIHASELVVLLLCTWEVMAQISVFVPVFSPFNMQILGWCLKLGHTCFCPHLFNHAW